jgi:hypothetical protein
MVKKLPAFNFNCSVFMRQFLYFDAIGGRKLLATRNLCVVDNVKIGDFY